MPSRCFKQKGARDAPPRAVVEQVDGPGLVEHPDAPREQLVVEAAHDLDAGEVAPVDRAVKRLARERLLVDRAVLAPVEEAPHPGLERADHVGRFGDERPGEFLVVQELAACDRVAEVPFRGIGGIERRVEAALHEPRAAALADEALRGEHDVEGRVRVVGVQRGHQTRAAAPEDQHIAGERVPLRGHH